MNLSEIRQGVFNLRPVHEMAYPPDLLRALGMAKPTPKRARPSKKVSATTKAKRKRTRASRKANR